MLAARSCPVGRVYDTRTVALPPLRATTIGSAGVVDTIVNPGGTGAESVAPVIVSSIVPALVIVKSRSATTPSCVSAHVRSIGSVSIFGMIPTPWSLAVRSSIVPSQTGLMSAEYVASPAGRNNTRISTDLPLLRSTVVTGLPPSIRPTILNT